MSETCVIHVGGWDPGPHLTVTSLPVSVSLDMAMENKAKCASCVQHREGRFGGGGYWVPDPQARKFGFSQLILDPPT